MKGRSSTKQGEMEVDKEGTHLSGAYIRSLVKQLTSSRTTTKDPNLAVQGDGFPSGRYHSFGDGQASISEEGMPLPPQQPPPQQPKKQVRRRLHTTRPYQERLLNMAEARREIVTALKFHRASMKHQSNEQQQQPPPSQQLQPPPPPPPQEGKATKCRRNPRIYPSNNSDFYSNYCSLPTSNYPWHASQFPPPTPENFDLSLPNQTLGLNLNFQDFNNLDATFYHSSSNPSSIFSSSISPTSSSSISNPSPTNTSSITINQEVPSGSSPGGGLGLHHAIDDEEMEEIRWIGEQHDMEWNDTMNLVTSAWWFKFLKTTEIGAEESQKDDDDAYYPFEEVMEFPAWLNANESCMQQHCFSEPLDDLMEDVSLPCMDIGEIEGMDGEWWA